MLRPRGYLVATVLVVATSFAAIHAESPTVSQPQLSPPTQNTAPSAARSSIRAPESVSSSHEERIERITAFSSAALAVFTALLCWATFALASSTKGLRRYAEVQAEDMKRSIVAATRSADAAERALVAANRPWITVSFTPAGPIEYDVNGARFPILYTLSNIGHSPATNVWVAPRLISIFPDPQMIQGINPANELAKDIAVMKSRDRMPFGHTLFPNQTMDQSITVIMSHDEIRRSTQTIAALFPTIVGAVEYRMGFDDRAHYTGFIFNIRRRDIPRPATTEMNRSPSAIWVDEGAVPAADIVLTQSFLDASFAD